MATVAAASTSLRALGDSRDKWVDLASSHALLLKHYASKSDSGKYVSLSVDTQSLYLAGDAISAVIAINPAVRQEIESIEIDFKGEVHTFGYTHTGPGGMGMARGGPQRSLQLEKQVFLQNSAMIQVPSMVSRQTSGLMSVSQRGKEEPFVLVAKSQLPLPQMVGPGNRPVDLPCIYHDSHTGYPAAFVTYHWKVTAHRKGLLKSGERLWKPLMVMASAISPANNSIFSHLPTYPPNSFYRVAKLQREIKKFVVKTAAMMEMQLAIPNLVNWPMFRSVPVIVRLTMRAKTPSDLLEPKQFTLPTLPGPSSGISKSAPGTPHFFIHQTRQSRVSMSAYENLRDRSICKCQWDDGHIGNGFTQQADGQGFEPGGREGSTPVADQRAKEGRSHGWTWPSRNDSSTSTDVNDTPDMPKEKGGASEETMTPSKGDAKLLKTFHYVSTCTLIGRIYLGAHPSVHMNYLQVFNELSFYWAIDGLRNDIEATVGAVQVNLGLDMHHANTVPRAQLQAAIIQPEMLDERSELLQGYSYDAPPPLTADLLDEGLPHYSGPSRSSPRR